MSNVFPAPSALLVDGDNIRAEFAPDLLRIAGGRDSAPGIVRAYGNLDQCKGWMTAPGFRAFHAGGAKNGADVLLAIDAMAFALRDGVRRFTIASSDGDFVHIAMRLRELGCHVTGAGESKTPEQFRAACSAFVVLRYEKHDAAPAAESNGSSPSALDCNIREAIRVNSQKGRGMPIKDLNGWMLKHHDFKISEQPEMTWRAYLSERGILYDLDPKGPEAKVRFLPDGFAAR